MTCDNCGKTTEETVYFTIEHKGKTYTFCCLNCYEEKTKKLGIFKELKKEQQHRFKRLMQR